MIILAWIVLTIIIAWYGGYRKIGFWGAFFLSLLLSPIFGFIAVALSDRKNPPEVRIIQQSPTAETRMHCERPESEKPTSVTDEIAKLKSSSMKAQLMIWNSNNKRKSYFLYHYQPIMSVKQY
ncbi:MAG: hypothetical protein WC865_03810 [Bacteroidales bacterium]